MNCKPGDIAMIIGVCVPEESVDLGKLVRVIGPCEDFSDAGDSRHHWECDTLGQRLTSQIYDDFGNYEIELTDGEETTNIPDACLFPIRDPGDHAVDEMIIRAELLKTIPA